MRFGVKGGQVAVVSFAVSVLLALLAAGGFLHARRTPSDEEFGAAKTRKLSAV